MVIKIRTKYIQCKNFKVLSAQPGKFAPRFGTKGNVRVLRADHLCSDNLAIFQRNNPVHTAGEIMVMRND